MTEMQRNLDRIASWLEENYPLGSVYFKPGLSQAESRRVFDDLPFLIANEVLELYAWRNGMSDDFVSSFAFLGMDFYSASIALSLHLEIAEDLPGYINSSLFPLFTLGDYGYVFTLGAKRSRNTSPVFYLDLEDISLMLMHESLTKMILTITECCNEGIFSIEQGEYSAVTRLNESEFEKIRRANNPNIPQPIEYSLDDFSYEQS